MNQEKSLEKETTFFQSAKESGLNNKPMLLMSLFLKASSSIKKPFISQLVSFPIMKENLARRFKQLNIVHREMVILSSGKTSNFYVDVKKAYGNPEARAVMRDAIWEQMDKRTTCVAGAGYGGIPLATSLSDHYNLKLTMVRDTPKQHGLGGWIDGYVPTEEDLVSIVDDVFTTGGSLRKTVGLIEPTRAIILGAHVVVKRGEGELSVPLSYLLIPEDLF